MARPPQTPRLSTLDPAAVAADVCAGLLAQLAGIGEALYPVRVRADVDKPALLAEASRVGQAVQRLVRYAQGAHVDGDPVDEVTQLLGLDVSAAWLEMPIGVAFVAASGRRKLEAGQPLMVRELAALGGIDPNALRVQVRAGKVSASGRGDMMTFGAATARKWLETRGWRTK